MSVELQSGKLGRHLAETGKSMLKKIYVDNYRCLVNFELDLGKMILLMGPNGGGKSTLFDLLRNIRHLLVDNAKVNNVFPAEELNAWAGNTKQTLELYVGNDTDLYVYRLIVSHNPDINKQRIDLETLTINDHTLFEFKQGEVQLYTDHFEAGPRYPFDWSISALATIVPRGNNKKLTWFREWVEKLFIISLQPRHMDSVTVEESSWLNHDGSNFASWYRYISQEHQDKAFALTEELRRIVPGFHSFKLEAAGKQRILKIGFTADDSLSSPLFFDFRQLSDGQRVIIVLYSILHGLRNLGNSILLDEPENYVSLAEIQPWLMELKEACEEDFAQAILISHHPELIDYLAPEYGRWIQREPLGPSRVKSLPENIDPSLKLSEHIARGWVS